MIKTMVIATDGSDHAEKAVAFGADIAGKYGARIVLVHTLLRHEISENLREIARVEHLAGEEGKQMAKAVAAIPEGRFPASITFEESATKTPYRVLEAIGEQVLNRAESVAREHGCTNIDSRLEDGDPVKRILEAAEDEKADVIVCGSRGLSDFKGLITGSVSHKLSNLSPVTVVSVR
jgi:nucleotide-binding universal stress UspA family protein